MKKMSLMLCEFLSPQTLACVKAFSSPYTSEVIDEIAGDKVANVVILLVFILQAKYKFCRSEKKVSQITILIKGLFFYSSKFIAKPD